MQSTYISISTFLTTNVMFKSPVTQQKIIKRGSNFALFENVRSQIIIIAIFITIIIMFIITTIFHIIFIASKVKIGGREMWREWGALHLRHCLNIIT